MELLKTKKSGFESAFFVIIVLFAVIIFMIILSKSWGEIKTPLEVGLQNAMPNDTSVNISETLVTVTETTNLFDKLIPFLLIGLFAFVMIGAAVYMQHPIMAIVGIIVLAVVILLAIVYANIYHQISASDEFASTTENFSISDTLMNYLPIIIIVLFIGITAAVAWSKGSRGGGL